MILQHQVRSAVIAVTIVIAVVAPAQQMREYTVIPDSAMFTNALPLIATRALGEAETLLRNVCVYTADSEIASHSRAGDLGCMVLANVIIEQRENPAMPAEHFGSVYWGIGNDLRQLGYPKLARAMFEVSVNRTPSEFQAWYSLGHLERGEGDLDAARENFRKCTEVAPTDEYGYYWLATVMMEQGALKEAEEALAQAESLAPEDGRMPYRRGEIAMRREDCDGAIREFRRAQALGVDKTAVKEKIKECKARMKASKKE